MLLRNAGMHVIGTADTADTGYRLALARRPDVAIIDIGLNEGNGVELTRRILENDPEAGIVVYTGLSDPDEIDAAAHSGARGFALKAGGPEDLTAAIRVVAAGGTWIDPALARLLAPSLASGNVLTAREREILQMLAGGLTGEEVAVRLVLSPETVRTHVRNAMNKLNAKTRAHAIALAVREREIEP
jgi:DNA-binding NarL/FixJ family response regulator